MLLLLSLLFLAWAHGSSDRAVPLSYATASECQVSSVYAWGIGVTHCPEQFNGLRTASNVSFTGQGSDIMLHFSCGSPNQWYPCSSDANWTVSTNYTSRSLASIQWENPKHECVQVYHAVHKHTGECYSEFACPYVLFSRRRSDVPRIAPVASEQERAVQASPPSSHSHSASECKNRVAVGYSNYFVQSSCPSEYPTNGLPIDVSDIPTFAWTSAGITSSFNLSYSGGNLLHVYCNTGLFSWGGSDCKSSDSEKVFIRKEPIDMKSSEWLANKCILAYQSSSDSSCYQGFVCPYSKFPRAITPDRLAANIRMAKR